MAIRQLKPYLKNIADVIRDKTTDAVNLLDYKTARNRDGYTGGVFEFTDIGFTYTGTYYFVFDISLEANKTYILSCDFDTGTVGTPTWCLIYADGTRGTAYVNKPITPTSDVVAIWIYPKVGETSTGTSTFNNLMLEEGEIAHEYVPYGYKEPINAQDFPSKIAEVYDKGKQTEYERFWDSFQNYGKMVFYSNAFSGYGWTDETFKPKYPIVTDNQPNRTNQMFSYAYNLKNLMIPLYFYDTASNSTFANCRDLIKIGDDTGGGIWTTRNRTWTTNFSSSRNLKEIRFIDYNEKGEYVPSEIGNSIGFKDSPLLSVESQINIIKHLVDFSGTSDAGTRILTIHHTAFEKLNQTYSSPSEVGIDFDGSWISYVESLGWSM